MLCPLWSSTCVGGRKIIAKNCVWLQIPFNHHTFHHNSLGSQDCIPLSTCPEARRQTRFKGSTVGGTVSSWNHKGYTSEYVRARKSTGHLLKYHYFLQLIRYLSRASSMLRTNSYKMTKSVPPCHHEMTTLVGRWGWDTLTENHVSSSLKHTFFSHFNISDAGMCLITDNVSV